MTDICVFTFDNNRNGIFHGGTVVIGSIELITTKVKTVRGIYVSTIGYGEVRWVKRTPHRDRGGRYDVEEEVFTSKETYLSDKSYLVGEKHGTPEELPPGRYNYEFEIQLSQRLPSSFSGTYGQIQYEIICTVNNYKSPDNVFRKPFTIIKPLNLNINPIYRVPIDRQEEKTFWCGCCNMQPVHLDVHIPYSGYAPGQKIPVQVTVTNDSNFDLLGLDVRLKKYIKYSTEYPRPDVKQEDFKIMSKECGQILRHSKREFSSMLNIPSTQPSTLDSCKLISISYYIKVVARTPSFHRNCSLIIPITIGTIPLSTYVRPDIIITQPLSVELPEIHNDRPPPAYGYTSPPSYEEALNQSDAFINSKFSDDPPDDILERYMPKYPIYRRE